MSIRGPWYISASAIWDYVRLRGWPETEDSFARGEDALAGISERGEARYKGRQKNGLLRYETGRAHGRIRLLVSDAARPEGGRDQVVAVLGRHGSPPKC